MDNELFEDTPVECVYNNVKIHIDKYLLDLMLRRVEFEGKKFVRRKDAEALYGISETLLMKHAKKAGALYRRNKMVLINVDLMDEYFRAKYKEERKTEAELRTEQENCFISCPWYPRGEDNSCRLRISSQKSDKQ